MPKTLAVPSELLRHQAPRQACRISDMEKRKVILGYSRSSNRGGQVVKHHFNLISNCITATRRENTMFYVVEIWKR